ncbi:putative transport protein, major facilitator superfamily (MFS) of permeases [Serratia symbiotica str. 'Cinara cedri']|nr:putative transport protein, major facilitator superfamily (MFS) of permeases [Serratia symbiotica str. 'Cinara cedri']
MHDNNQTRLVWISFLSYALTGALVIVTGMVMGDIAKYFNLPISHMSNTFTFLNTGILIAIFLNAWLMEIVPLKNQFFFGFILMMLAIIGLIVNKWLAVFSLCMFILGIVSGITMSIGTFLITHIYTGRQRGSRLLLTDSFFSMSGMLFPIIAAALLEHHINWYWIYACIGLLYLGIFLLTLSTKFPVLVKNKIKVQEPIAKEKWGIGVFFLSIAALCYILGQLGFIQWVPEYAIKSFNMSINQAGKLVSNFWMSYMIGMWVFSYILRFFDLQRIVTILSLLSTIAIYLFINTKNLYYLSYYILALGFVSSAIYTTLITLGSLQTKYSSPKIVNFILTCGTIGTMLTFIVTGPIVEKGGVHAALTTAAGLYAMVTVICILLGFVTKHRHYNNHITY